jgi:predicted RNA binding protein YcfA (HicA-like mRNA interferase family)
MPKLPQISGRECVKALEKAGFYFLRQTGSHIHVRRDTPFAQVAIPNHKRGTLQSVIRQSGLSVDEFLELLK